MSANDGQTQTYTIRVSAIPAPPRDLQLDAIGYDSLDLSWSDNSNSETGFELELRAGALGSYEFLDTVADAYETEADDRITGMISMIEPVMTVGLALMVGFIAVSVIAPMYSMTGAFE